MAEPDIKRINFFDGLFLKQGEFQAEQQYHLHMRRRINYMLFQSSGVVQIEPSDLRVTPTTAKRFLVTSGMAVSYRPDLKEGREVVLTADSAELDLAALGFSGTDEVIVAIHYEPQPSEPQIGVSPPTETRLNEQAIVTVHDAADSWPPATPLQYDEQYIRLGRIRFSDMEVLKVSATEWADRQTAVVRSALFGGGATSPAPTISGINPNTGAPGDSISGAIITGTNLSGVTTSNVTESTGDITNIVVNSASADGTTVNLDFDIQPGATSGAKSITVTTLHGSAPVPFTVVIGTPVVVVTMLPSSPNANQRGVRIRGTNIRNPAIPNGSAATGTLVRFVDATDLAKMTSDVVPRANANAGTNQEIELTIPVEAAFSGFNGIPGVPAPLSSRQVFVQVEFGGISGTKETTNDIDF